MRDATRVIGHWRANMRTKALAFSLLETTILFVPWLPIGAQETGTTAITRSERSKLPNFDSAPGWEWMMRPQELRIGRRFGQLSDNGILSGYSVVDADGGALRISFVQAGPSVMGSLLGTGKIVR
jgi:hypothetical protein